MQQQTILIVEDDPTLQFVASRALTHLGYRCLAVGSGEAALEADHTQVSLILMDIGLPGIDGTKTASMIRELEARDGRPRVPIVALTAHSDRQACLQASMDDFLQKPALLGDLQQMVGKWLPQTE